MVCALQIGLATLHSIAPRIPAVKTANVKAMGFAWGGRARGDLTDLEYDSEEALGAPNTGVDGS